MFHYTTLFLDAATYGNNRASDMATVHVFCNVLIIIQFSINIVLVSILEINFNLVFMCHVLLKAQS